MAFQTLSQPQMVNMAFNKLREIKSLSAFRKWMVHYKDRMTLALTTNTGSKWFINKAVFSRSLKAMLTC